MTADAGPVRCRKSGWCRTWPTRWAYADLILAWGLTRFAEHTPAERVRRTGTAVLPAEIRSTRSCARGSSTGSPRCATAGRPAARHPAPVGPKIDRLSGLPRYAIDKLREHSRVLEPTARVGGYEDVIFRKGRPDSPTDQVAGRRRSLTKELIRILETEAARHGRPHLAGAMLAALDRAAKWTDGTAVPVFALCRRAGRGRQSAGGGGPADRPRAGGGRPVGPGRGGP